MGPRVTVIKKVKTKTNKNQGVVFFLLSVDGNMDLLEGICNYKSLKRKNNKSHNTVLIWGGHSDNKLYTDPLLVRAR